MISWNNYY